MIRYKEYLVLLWVQVETQKKEPKEAERAEICVHDKERS